MIWVVAPTYNERENIGVLIEKIFALRIPELKMMVVDDNSPDGTAEVAEEFSKKYPVSVIRRSKKLGLGTAYAEAFREILDGSEAGKLVSGFDAASGHGSAEGGERASITPSEPRRGERGKRNGLVASQASDIIIQIDADLSHDPAVIPVFLEKIKNCDLVLGSRYIAEGKIVNWDKTRQLISKFGNAYARTVLGLPYADLTGGFKCWRADLLSKIDFASLSSIGYNFQIETTYQAHQLDAKIIEHPIIFTERKFGISKFNFPIMLEAFWKVLLLKLESHQNAKN